MRTGANRKRFQNIVVVALSVTLLLGTLPLSAFAAPSGGGAMEKEELTIQNEEDGTSSTPALEEATHTPEAIEDEENAVVSAPTPESTAEATPDMPEPMAEVPAVEATPTTPALPQGIQPMSLTNPAITVATTPGDLQNSVEAAINTQGGEPADKLSITSLTVTGTELNDADYTFIRNELKALVTLDVSGMSFTALPNKALNYDFAYPNNTITTVKLPVSLTTVGEMAFKHCAALTTVQLPPGVTTIGDSAFDNCTKLVTVGDDLSKVTTVGNSAFSNCKALVFPLGTLQIGFTNGISTLGVYAFYSCEELAEANLSNSVTAIPQGAFYGCITLEGFSTFGLSYAQITSVGEYAFYNCHNLSSDISSAIGYTSGISTLGKYAFYGCKKIQAVRLAPSITTIPEYAFYNCKLLISVGNDLSKVTSVGDYAFSGGNLDWCINLVFPSGDATMLGATNGISTLGQYAFYMCLKLEKVRLAAGIAAIAEYAFTNCAVLTTVGNDLSKVTSVSKSAFGNCMALVFPSGGATMVGADSGISTLGPAAFTGCWKLEKVRLAAGITAIPSTAFLGCAMLTTVGNDLSKVTSVGENAFSDSTKLVFPSGDSTMIGAANGISTLEKSAFSGCLKLEKVQLAASITAIPSYAFKSCSALTTVGSDLSNVTSVGEYTFDDCNALVFPNGDATMVGAAGGVSTMDNYAFQNCAKLERINLSNATAIEQQAFDGCTMLYDIQWWSSAPTIGSDAFRGCALDFSGGFPAGLTAANATNQVPKVLFSLDKTGPETIGVGQAFTMPQPVYKGTSGNAYANVIASDPTNTWLKAGTTAPGTATLSITKNGVPTGAQTVNTANAGTYVLTYALNPQTLYADALSRSFTLVVSASSAPAITSANNTSVVRGTGGTFQVIATGTAPITYALSGTVPAGVSINMTSGVMTILGTTAPGTHTFTVTASNGVGSPATQSFTLTVKAAFTITGQAALMLTQGYAAQSTGVYTLTGTAPVTVSKTSGNALISWNDGTKTLDIAAGLSAGIYPVELKVSNGTAPDATLTFTLTVTANDVAPTITNTPSYTCAAGTNGSYPLTADGTAPITFALSGEPAGVSISGDNLVVGNSVAENIYHFTVTASNVAGNSTPQSFTLTVTTANTAPTITGPTALTLAQGYAAQSTGVYTLTGTAPVTVTKTSGNVAIAWNDGTKTLDIAAGLPAGSYPVELKASNGTNPDATLTFALTVAGTPPPPAGTAPTITGPTALTLTQGYAARSTGVYTLTGTAPVAVIKTSGNAAITWNDGTKKLDIAAGLTAGSYPVVLKAANGTSPDATLSFTLTVKPVTSSSSQAPGSSSAPPSSSSAASSTSSSTGGSTGQPLPASSSRPVQSSSSAAASSSASSGSSSVASLSPAVSSTSTSQKSGGVPTPAELAQNPPKPAVGESFTITAPEGSLAWDEAMLEGAYDAATGTYTFTPLQAGDTEITHTDENGVETVITVTIAGEAAPLANVKNEGGFAWWILLLVGVLAGGAVLVVVLVRRRKNEDS